MKKKCAKYASKYSIFNIIVFINKIKNCFYLSDTSIQIDSQVQPFVEVMFQRMAVKTGIADGPHPTWNQELELTFRYTSIFNSLCFVLV